MSFKVSRRSRQAFSLVEIMIVIVIIGLLAGVVGVNIRRNLIQAKQNVAKQDIANIVKALDMFWAEAGHYPTNEEGLNVLVEPTEKNAEPLLSGGPSALLDPWNNPYQYNSPAAEAPYEVISLGGDGREGGTGGDGDISSVDLKK